jgi:hypothetical protein
MYWKNEAAQIAVSGKRMSAGQIETTLDGLMKVPARYFKDYEYAFIAYARIYGRKRTRAPNLWRGFPPSPGNAELNP